jgi:hypothetical protein
MYLKAGGSGKDSVHVLSIITPTLSSRNVWGQAFCDNKHYLLLLSMRFGAMTTCFFFTNQSEVDFGIAHMPNIQNHKPRPLQT